MTRLPANWRPGGDHAPPTPERKPRAPRGSREEPPADLRLKGPFEEGVMFGKLHLWKRMGYTYLSGCGHQFHRPGWIPVRDDVEKCPRCWGGED